MRSDEGPCHIGLNRAVKSSSLNWTGQFKKCVQYNFNLPALQGAGGCDDLGNILYRSMDTTNCFENIENSLRI